MSSILAANPCNVIVLPRKAAILIIITWYIAEHYKRSLSGPRKEFCGPLKIQSKMLDSASNWNDITFDKELTKCWILCIQETVLLDGESPHLNSYWATCRHSYLWLTTEHPTDLAHTFCFVISWDCPLRILSIQSIFMFQLLLHSFMIVTSV